nr:hypothetical protein [Tanacetum cinerariifolium]
MSTPKFAETHNLVAFLKKPTESKGFEKIIYFLNASYVKYALTVNPTVYTSCIEQFWATAKVMNVNREAQIQALSDKKKVIITEASIRRDHSEIPNEESVPTPSNDPLPSGELMILCTNLQKQVLDLEEEKTAQAKEISSLNKRVEKFEQKRKSRTSRLKRLRKIRTTSRIESSTKSSFGDQEDASKQGRMIDNINQDVEITLVDDTQGRMNEEDMFGVNDLDGDEVVVDVSASEKVEQSEKVVEKEVSTADPVTTADEVVTIEGIEVTTAGTTLQISKDELTLAQTLIDIKTAKPKAITTAATTVTAAGTRPKEKGIWIEAFVPMDTELVKGSDKVVEGSEKAKEGSSIRAACNLEQENAKRQRMEEENESTEPKRCLEIVTEDDDDVTIEATPLSSKSPTIVDYKI